MIYRDVMHTPRLDWCNLMKVETTNKIVETVMQLARKFVPSALHKCPYTVLNINLLWIFIFSLLSSQTSGNYSEKC